jgi:hypothetical protein
VEELLGTVSRVAYGQCTDHPGNPDEGDYSPGLHFGVEVCSHRIAQKQACKAESMWPGTLLRFVRRDQTNLTSSADRTRRLHVL